MVFLDKQRAQLTDQYVVLTAYVSPSTHALNHLTSLTFGAYYLSILTITPNVCCQSYSVYVIVASGSEAAARELARSVDARPTHQCCPSETNHHFLLCSFVLQFSFHHLYYLSSYLKHITWVLSITFSAHHPCIFACRHYIAGNVIHEHISRHGQ